MARIKKVNRLPAAVRETIGRLRNEGRTLDEILAKLKELHAPIARTTLYRHLADLDAISADIRRSRAVADAIVARYGDAPESKVARLNVELLHGAILKTMSGQDGVPRSFEPSELQALATALQRGQAAEKATAELALRLRKELGAKIGGAIEEAEKAIAGNTTLPAERRRSMADVLRQIRQDVYGIITHDAPAESAAATPRKGLSPETIRTIETEILGISR